MITRLSIAEVLYLHFRIVKRTGGSQGVLDVALLESALGRPFASFGGQDLFPGVVDKAAALIHAIITNHPFIDGNKRTGIAVAAIFLRKNQYRLKATQDEVVAFTLEIAQGFHDVSQVKEWLCSHSEKML